MAAGFRNFVLGSGALCSRCAPRVAALLAGALLAGSAGAGVPPPGTLASPRAVIASGGGVSQGGVFRLRDTLGQPLAHQASSGGAFRLRGGFWVADPAARETAVFADGFEPLPAAPSHASRPVER